MFLVQMRFVRATKVVPPWTWHAIGLMGRNVGLAMTWPQQLWARLMHASLPGTGNQF